TPRNWGEGEWQDTTRAQRRQKATTITLIFAFLPGFCTKPEMTADTANRTHSDPWGTALTPELHSRTLRPTEVAVLRTMLLGVAVATCTLAGCGSSATPPQFEEKQVVLEEVYQLLQLPEGQGKPPARRIEDLYVYENASPRAYAA